MLSLLKLIILKEYINYAMFSSLVLHILLYVLWDKLVAQCLFFFFMFGGAACDVCLLCPFTKPFQSMPSPQRTS